MSGFDPIARARAIYEKRFGRKVGAMATLAGVTAAGVLGFLRYEQYASYSYALVASVLAGGILIGPAADRLARRWVGRRMQAALDAESESSVDDDDATLVIRQRFRAQSLATEEERAGTTWPLAKTAVLSVVGWLWPVAMIEGSGLTLVGKTMSYLAAHGGPTVVLFAFAAFLQGRSTKPRRRGLATTLVVMTAMLLPALTTDNGFIGVAVTAFALGMAGLFVMTPATWWMRRRTTREKGALAKLVLPPSTSDTDDARRLLRSTLEWEACPGALRARALHELAARMGAEAIAPDIDRSIQSPVPELRLAALELAHRLHHRPRLGVLLEATADGTPEQAVLLPALLHRHTGPDVEAALLSLLVHDDNKVAKAAAESLGLVGTVDVVVPLKAAAARPGLAKVITQAVERIRIRLAVGPGQLSLVDEREIGALSNVPNAAALSVVDP